jgi:signal peptidase I
MELGMPIETVQPKNPSEQSEADPAVVEGPYLRLWNFIRPIAILILILFAVRSSIADWNDVPTGSMIPTILVGDRIFVNKLAYDLKVPFTTWHIAEWSGPKRGDIVVFFSPEPSGTRLVKRCVAIPGDTLEVRENKLIINGVEIPYAPLDPAPMKYIPPNEKQSLRYLTETLGDHVHPIREGKLYHNANPYKDFGPITIPQGKYFMMGDNRDDSRDARWFGPVARGNIVGRATAVAISLDLNHYWIPRWSRFFSSLP